MSFNNIDSSTIFTHILDKALFKSSNNYKEGPLTGLSFSVKDNISIINHASTLGCSNSDLPVSLKSASSIQTLQDLGAQLIGATQMDDYALGSYGESSICGRAINPIDKDIICGGSSFGSALSVAHKLCDFSLATDSGGSTRIPAVACGISSIKLTSEYLPREGTYFVDEELDSFGVLASSLQDLKLVCQNINLLPGQIKNDSNTDLLAPSMTELEVCNKDILSEFLKITQKLSSEFNFKLLNNHICFSRAINIRKILFARSFDRFIYKYRIKERFLSKEALALIALSKSIDDKALTKIELDAKAFKVEIINILDEVSLLTPAIPTKLPTWKDLDSGVFPYPTLNHFLVIANVCDLPAVVFPIKQNGLTFNLQLLGHPRSSLNLIDLALTIQSNYSTY